MGQVWDKLNLSLRLGLVKWEKLGQVGQVADKLKVKKRAINHVNKSIKMIFRLLLLSFVYAFLVRPVS